MTLILSLTALISCKITCFSCSEEESEESTNDHYAELGRNDVESGCRLLRLSMALIESHHQNLPDSQNPDNLRIIKHVRFTIPNIQDCIEPELALIIPGTPGPRRTLNGTRRISRKRRHQHDPFPMWPFGVTFLLAIVVVLVGIFL